MPCHSTRLVNYLNLSDFLSYRHCLALSQSKHKMRIVKQFRVRREWTKVWVNASWMIYFIWLNSIDRCRNGNGKILLAANAAEEICSATLYMGCWVDLVYRSWDKGHIWDYPHYSQAVHSRQRGRRSNTTQSWMLRGMNNASSWHFEQRPDRWLRWD